MGGGRRDLRGREDRTVLFYPSFVGNEATDVRDATFQPIVKFDVDIRKGQCSNVVLSGDTTMLAGIGGHMDKEFIVLAPSTVKVKAVVPPVRTYSACIR